MIDLYLLINLIVIFLITFPVVGKSFYSKENLPGIGFALVIAIPCWILGQKIPVAGGSVFGILAGMLLVMVKRPSYLEKGIKTAAKKLLQAAIVLFGFDMNLNRVIEVGSQSLVLMIFTISAALLTAYAVSKIFKMEPITSTLVGVGTSICGGSAIAATAPVIGAEDEQVATAISTIFLYNVLAVFIFPALGRAMGMSDTQFGMWAGTAINDTSSVVAAAMDYSVAAGNFATIVKLTRTLMIIPITFILALYTARKNKSEASGFSVAKVFPWFVLGFLLTSLINTIGFVPAASASFFGKTGKFMVVAAMAAIGLNTNLKNLISNSKQALLLGGICWFVVSVSSLIVQFAMDI